jgi:hypothetical protein
MWKNSIAGLAVSLIFVIANEASGQGLSLLNGSWKVTSGSLHGVQVPQSAFESMSLAIANGTFTSKSGIYDSSGSLTQSAAGSNRVQFSITGGSDAGRQLFAIYKVENAIMTITFAESDFPNAFDSNGQNRYLTLTYRNANATQVPGDPSSGKVQSGDGTGAIE